MKVLVTGAGRGLGRGIALRLARRGHLVVVHYRSDAEAAAETARLVEQSGGSAELVNGDLTDPDQVTAMMTAVAERAGGLDGLVNNVGGFLIKHVSELTPEEWDAQLASTVSATFYVTQAALPLLRESAAGRVVNVSDSGAESLLARPRALPYYVGKTGVLLITRTLAVTEARYGITVNAVLPGVLENSVTLPDLERIPAGRLGTFEDVAAAVEFLLSPEASYVTGSFVQVGGGWNL